MKKMKKALAVILSLAMVLGMSLTTFAADPIPEKAEGTNKDKGTITIEGLGNTGATGTVTVSAYKIVEAKYENGGGLFSGYSEVYAGKLGENMSLDIAGVKPGGSLSISREYLNAVNDYITTNKIEATATKEISAADTSCTFDDMAVGSYLILITGAEASIYSPMVGSVMYVTPSGDPITNMLESGNIDVVGTNEWVKKSDNPTIDKKIVESNGTDHSNSVNIGDTVPYEVKVAPIPFYGGKFPVFNIVDTLDKGLTYNNNMVVTIYNNGTLEHTFGDEDAKKPIITPKTDETTGITTIKVEFAKDFDYILNKYQGMEVRLNYSATLNENATMNQIANVNNVKLEYTHDSKVDSDDVKDTDEDETYTYTFDIDAAVEGSVTNRIVTKIGEEIKEVENVNPKALKGAKFGVYTDADCTTPYKQNNKNIVLESDEEGQLRIKGLGASEKDGGTSYYLKETEPPTGYTLNTNVYEIKITPVYDKTGEDAPKLTKWTIDVKEGTKVIGTNVFDIVYEKDADGKVTNIKVSLNSEMIFDQGTLDEGTQVENVKESEIKNTKLASLPSTGGIGTTIFTIGGCAIMIIAAALFFASRRRAVK